MSSVELAAGIIPLRKKEDILEVLLILHAKGYYWSFPKGHIEENELKRVAAKRELLEETGYEVEKFVDGPSLFESYVFNRGKSSIRKDVDYFPAFVKEKNLFEKSDEVLDLKWVSLNEALKIITFKESRELLEDFMKQNSF